MAVYIAMRATDGAVKIGTSSDPEKRIKKLSWQEKSDVSVLRIIDGSFREERWLHELFSESNIRGEWFRFCEDMLTVSVPKMDIMPTMEGTAQPKIRAWLQNEGRFGLWLAAKVPCNPSTLSLWLAGRRVPNAMARYRLWNITGIDVTDEAGWK